MRLREPFAGMRLSSGHLLVHVAYFMGSYLPMNYGANYEDENASDHNLAKAQQVLFLLRCSHVIAPILIFGQHLSFLRGFHFLEQVLNRASIFIVQGVIFHT